MQVSPYLTQPVRPRWAAEAERDAYFVMAEYCQKFEWQGFPTGYTEAALIEDIAANQFDQATAVFHRHGKRFEDVSEAIAEAALAAYIDGHDGSVENIPTFCTLHISNAVEQVEEAIQDAERDQEHIRSERYAGAR